VISVGVLALALASIQFGTDLEHLPPDQTIRDAVALALGAFLAAAAAYLKSRE